MSPFNLLPYYISFNFISTKSYPFCLYGQQAVFSCNDNHCDKKTTEQKNLPCVCIRKDFFYCIPHIFLLLLLIIKKAAFLLESGFKIFKKTCLMINHKNKIIKVCIQLLLSRWICCIIKSTCRRICHSVGCIVFTLIGRTVIKNTST